jgi:hypothetical protein
MYTCTMRSSFKLETTNKQNFIFHNTRTSLHFFLSFSTAELLSPRWYYFLSPADGPIYVKRAFSDDSAGGRLIVHLFLHKKKTHDNVLGQFTMSHVIVEM